jgi:hypothetical protein
MVEKEDQKTIMLEEILNANFNMDKCLFLHADVYKYKSPGICILSESSSMEGALNKIFDSIPIALFSDSKLDKSTIIKASNLMKFKSKLDEEFNFNLSSFNFFIL